MFLEILRNESKFESEKRLFEYCDRPGVFLGIYLMFFIDAVINTGE